MGAPASTAPFLAATAVLGLAGLAKLWRPADTARALHVAGMRVSWRTVRVGAITEVAVAAAALAVPGVLTGSLVSASYAGFAGFVWVALWKGWPLSSCGCFGRADSRPSYQHLVLDLAAAGTAGWWAASAPGRLGPLFVHQPWDGAPLVVVSSVIAGLAYLVWSNPALQEAM